METITIKPELKFTPNATGLRQVYIRITQNRKHIRKRLNIALKSNQWDGKYGSWVNRSHPEYKFLNTTIQTELTKYEKEYLKLGEDNKAIDKEDVFKAVNKVLYNQDFMQFYDLQMNGFKNWSQYRCYNTTRNYILGYTNNKKFSFKDINEAWLDGFAEYLSNELNLTSSSVHTQQRRIRRTFNVAIQKKIVDKSIYPFGLGNYKMPVVVETKVIERLNTEELKLLFKMEYDRNELIYFAHAGFVLAFELAGIRVEDLLTLKWSNIKNGQISYNMKKGVTRGTFMSFAIKPQVAKLLEGLRHSETKPDDYLLPFIPYGTKEDTSQDYKELISRKTALYNKYLKKVGADLGTEKNMTSHLARHSWAAFTYEKTRDIRFIQKNLGHKDIKTTMRYIGQLTTIENDQKLEKLNDELYAA